MRKILPTIFGSGMKFRSDKSVNKKDQSRKLSSSRTR